MTTSSLLTKALVRADHRRYVREFGAEIDIRAFYELSAGAPRGRRSRCRRRWKPPDEPPPEVSAAGHDRCIVPIRPEHVDAWLSPNPKNLVAKYTILDDRARPYCEHRLAA